MKWEKEVRTVLDKVHNDGKNECSSYSERAFISISTLLREAEIKGIKSVELPQRDGNKFEKEFDTTNYIAVGYNEAVDDLEDKKEKLIEGVE